MSGLTFMVLLCIGLWIWIFKQLFKKPPVEPHDTSFKVTTKRGELEVFIHYESPESIEPEIQRITRRWATKLEITGQPDEQVYDSLESELNRHFTDLNPIVVNLVLTTTEAVSETPAERSRAEQMDAALLDKVDCVETLIKRLEWIAENKPEVAKIFLKGRTVERKIKDLRDEGAKGLDDFVETELNNLFEHPDHV
jgi:hypothetical protein